VKVSRLVFWLIVALVVGSVLYAKYTPFRLLTLVASRRASVCPARNALESAANLRKQVALKDEILNKSRLFEKDPKGFHLWETPRGRFWIPEGNDYVLPFNLAEQARKIYGTGENGPKTGDITLDCGANIGVTVRDELAAGAIKVVAIEPAPENVESLRRNFPDQIASGRVVVYPKGVWDKDDFLMLHVVPNNSAADSFVMHPEGAVDALKIGLTTIDKIVAELKLEHVDYIKMDIEGAESRALKGAREVLAKWKPRLSISTEHEENDPVEIIGIVTSANSGYKWACGPCSEADHRIRPDVLYFH
jgi:FkbM family methyltransferase